MSVQRIKLKRAVLSPAIGLLLLSALWAIGWLRTDLIPQLGVDSLSPAQGQAALFSIAAVVAASIALLRRIEFPSGRRAWACAGVGIGLFVVPNVLAASVQGWISRLDQVAVLSLTPIFAVVLEPYLRDGEPCKGRAALAGAMVAVTGILCLFPLDIPGSFRATVALCALLVAVVGIAVANCLAVRLACSLPSGSTLPMAAQMSAACALCFAAAATFTPHPAWRWSAVTPQLLWLILIDLPALSLLFWLMRHLAASRMTARFLLAPLFAVVGGLALEPTSPPARAILGIALLAAGAAWLVFAPEELPEVDQPLSLNAHAAEISREPQGED